MIKRAARAKVWHLQCMWQGIGVFARHDVKRKIRERGGGAQKAELCSTLTEATLEPHILPESWQPAGLTDFYQEFSEGADAKLSDLTRRHATNEDENFSDANSHAHGVHRPAQEFGGLRHVSVRAIIFSEKDPSQLCLQCGRQRNLVPFCRDQAHMR